MINSICLNKEREGVDRAMLTQTLGKELDAKPQNRKRLKKSPSGNHEMVSQTSGKGSTQKSIIMAKATQTTPVKTTMEKQQPGAKPQTLLTIRRQTRQRGTSHQHKKGSERSGSLNWKGYR